MHKHRHGHTQRKGAAGVIMSCKLPSIPRGLFTCNQPHGASVHPAFNKKLLSATWRRGGCFCTPRNVASDKTLCSSVYFSFLYDRFMYCGVFLSITSSQKERRYKSSVQSSSLWLVFTYFVTKRTLMSVVIISAIKEGVR